MKMKKGTVTVIVKDNDPNKTLKVSGFKKMGFKEIASGPVTPGTPNTQPNT